MKPAAIYARYSSDRQRCSSIDDQVALCRAFAERLGFAIAGVYSDYELSGATVHRPEFTRLVADAEAGRFGVIIAEDTDRLARGEGDMPQLRRRMEFCGVDIHTCSDGKVTKLVAGLKGLTSSLFLDNLAQHTRRGLAGVVRSGRTAGGRAYGYRAVPGKPGVWSIDEAEAAIIRRVFADYARGLTPRQIAGALNAQGVPAPRGRRWNASTLNGNLARGCGLLLNPIYAGRIVWNRTRMVKNPASGRRVSRINPPEEHQSSAAPQLRIIGEELFARVQAIKAERGSMPIEKTRRPPRLLSGLLRCGACGGGMSSTGRHKKSGRARLYCSARRESGGCSNRRTIYIDAVERTVLDAIRAQLRAPKVMRAYVAEFNAELRRLAAQAAGGRSRLQHRAGEVDREIARGLDAIIKGVVDAETLRARMAQLTAERDQLAQQLAAAAQAHTVVALHPEALECYQRDVEHLAEAMAGGQALPDEPAAALRRLVAEVVIHVDGRAPGAAWEVEIKGRLASLVDAPLFPQATAYGDKAVAGERYRRAPILLEPLFSIRARAA